MRRTFWDLLTDMMAACGKGEARDGKQLAYLLGTSKSEIAKVMDFADKHGLIKELRLTSKGKLALDAWKSFKNVVLNEA